MQHAHATRTIEPLQYLRAFAAFLVVYHHASDQLKNAPSISNGFGQFGVDVFFVISGFIMFYVTETREKKPQEFLLKRIQRVAPPYWFYTIAIAGLALCIPSIFRGTEFSFDHFILSLGFVAHVNPATGTTSPLHRLGWTLNYEMFFYLLFALVLAFSHKRRHIWITVIIGTLVVIGGLVRPLNRIVEFYLNSIMLEFVFGVLLAWLLTSGRLRRVSTVMSFILAVFACACAFMGAGYIYGVLRPVFFGLPALLMVFAALNWPTIGGASGRMLALMGNASYSIYLVHIFPLSALRVVWSRLDLPESLFGNIAFVCIGMILVAVVGAISYRLVESPLVAWARKSLRVTSAEC